MRDLLVVKLGGAAGLNMRAAIGDLALIAAQRPVVVVHGVSERMAMLSAERGMAVETLVSPAGHESRYTPPPIRDLFVEAAGQVNAEIAGGLAELGVSAASLTAPLVLRGARKDAVRAVVDGRVRVIRDDHTGAITSVEPMLIRDALAAGRVAVVPPLAASADGPLNVDGDRAAAAIAVALGAAELVILSNVRGLYRRFRDETTFVSAVRLADMDEALNWAAGRMKRKVLGAQAALEGGVARIVIGDGRREYAVQAALNGEGTVFTR
ncbi:MAG: [LysW]-aminoadipate kinase [Anaerolineae bacterium]|nr:[LysW]-aminoadipate kinase [Anaerolineae bacterium]